MAERIKLDMPVQEQASCLELFIIDLGEDVYAKYTESINAGLYFFDAGGMAAASMGDGDEPSEEAVVEFIKTLSTVSQGLYHDEVDSEVSFLTACGRAMLNEKINAILAGASDES